VNPRAARVVRGTPRSHAAPASRDELLTLARREARLVRGRQSFVLSDRVVPIGVPLALALGTLAGLAEGRRRGAARGAAAFGAAAAVTLAASAAEALIEWEIFERRAAGGE
jgi:hypothetical protein